MSDASESMVPKRELLEQKRQVKRLKEHLTNLTAVVRAGLVEIDQLGARKDLPNDAGKRLAQISNTIEMANDKARYFGLGVDFRKDTKA